MFTGNNPYRFLEVVIQAGDLKGHFATVLDTRVFDGEVLATIRTDTRAINHMVELNMRHLKERQYVARNLFVFVTVDNLCSTLLSLPKAIWVPRTYLMSMPPDLVSQRRPKTPPYNPEGTTEEPLDSAWNPSSRLPCRCKASEDYLCVCEADIPQRPILPEPKPGVSLMLSRPLLLTVCWYRRVAA